MTLQFLNIQYTVMQQFLYSLCTKYDFHHYGEKKYSFKAHHIKNLICFDKYKLLKLL
jgi:hypothetical protein